jgi:hypothetical protein
MDTRHKRIQAKMNCDREWESIELAARILESLTKDNIAMAKIIKKNASEVKDIQSCSDDGDIYLFDKKNKVVKIVEVKRLDETNYSAEFVSRETWKFKNFIVDGVRQFNNKEPKPYLYMCFNSILSAVALCYTRTAGRWGTEMKAGNESLKEYYVADLQDVKFFKVEDLLKGS